MALPFPYGLNLIVNNPRPTPPDRREYVDSENQIQSARYIDPITKDFVLADNGHFVGQDAVAQRVYLSLITYFNTSAQSGLGNQFFNIKLITKNIVNKCNAAVRLALQDLIDTDVITLNSVSVTQIAAGSVLLTVRWTRNLDAETGTTEIPLGQG